MKKRISFLLAVIMILAVMVPAIPVIAYEASENMWAPTAEPPVYKINTPDDYKAFIKYVFVDSTSTLEGVTVTLERDLDFNSGIELANLTTGTNYGQTSSTWTKYFNGTFDGQNHTISGLYISSAGFLNGNIGFIPATAGGTIKNLKLDRFYIEGTHVAEGAANNALKSGVGALIGLSKGATIINCELSNGIVTAQATSVTATVGALIGNLAFEAGRVNLIKDVKVAPTVEVVSNGQSGSAFGGVIGFYYAKTTDTFDFDGSKINPKNADTTLPAIGVAEISSPMGHTFMNSNLLAVDSECGGTSAETTATGSPAYTAKLNAAVEGLMFYGSNAKTYDDIDEFTLYTKDDFLSFYKLLNIGQKDFDGKTVKLAFDIPLNTVGEGNWWESATTKLGQLSSAMYFRGTFDGNGKSITGAVVVGDNNHWAGGVGLFGCAQYATIKNLTLDGFYINNPTTGEDNSSTGSIVGYADKEVYIDNCTVKNGTVTAVTADVVSIGGLIGKIEANSPSAGKSTGNTTITKTVIEPSVVVTPPTATTLNAGGVIGMYSRDTRESHDYMDVSESRFQPTATGLPAIGFFTGYANNNVYKYTLYLTHSNNYEGFEAFTNMRENNNNIQTELAASFAPVYGATYEAPRVTFAGVQTNADGDIRFVGIVNGHEDFDVAGFVLTVGDDEMAFETTKAYDSLVAGGETVAPAGEGKYFTFVLTDVPADTTFSIRAYSSIVHPAYVDRYVSATYTYTYAPAVS